MSDKWQVYEKNGSRWVTVGAPMSKAFAEQIVSSKWAVLIIYERALADAKKRNAKRMPKDPGFREPHCVPV